MKEIWKPIKEFDDKYLISNFGRVKNTNTNKILKQKYNKSGYLYIGLFKNKKQHAFRTHRLVAKTFIPNPNNYPCINHKDEDRINNHADNLEWCTYKYNDNYGTRNLKLSTRNKGKNCKKIYQYDLKGNFIKEWEGIINASENLNIIRTNISECCRNLRKEAGGYIWKYKSSNSESQD